MNPESVDIAVAILAFAGGVLATFFASGGYTRERKSIQQELDIAKALDGANQRALLEHADDRVAAYLAKVKEKPRDRSDVVQLASLALGVGGAVGLVVLSEMSGRAILLIAAMLAASSGLAVVAHREIRQYRYVRLTQDTRKGGPADWGGKGI
jgi:Flp pilus assembly protein TadB